MTIASRVSTASAETQPHETAASTRRMLLLTTIDQGASSVSNFALAILVAHYSGARALGIFALLTSTYVLAQGAVRSLTSDCLMTRSETDRAVMARYEGGGYLSALILASGLSLVVLAVTGFMRADFAEPFAIFVVFFPLMALQDFSRYVGIRRHDPGYAIRLDVSWLVLFLFAFGGLRAMGWVSVPWLFGAWAATGAAVGLYTIRARLHRSVSLLRFWLRSELAVGLRFAGQFVLSSVSTYVIFYLLVLFVISVSAVGRIKLALLALGPVTVLANGVQSALISLAGRRFAQDRLGALRFLAAVGLATGAVAAAWTALVYATPVHLARIALGPTWPQARSLVLFAGLALVISGMSNSAIAGLRALRAAKENLHVAAASLPVVLLLDEGGAALWGAHGFVVGLALSSAIYSVMAWVVLLRTARQERVDEVVASMQPTTADAVEGSLSMPAAVFAEGG